MVKWCFQFSGGYGVYQRPDVKGGNFLVDCFGIGSAFALCAIKGRGFGGKIFVEGVQGIRFLRT
jgi:hypothetical protein